MKGVPTLHLALCCLISALILVESSPKTKLKHHKDKLNFGWPNMFNPQMGMKREKKKHKKGEKEGELGNDIEEHDEYEELTDYTLKGGLRGTLLLLTSNMDEKKMEGNLTETVKAVMEQDKEEQEADMQSEITEDGYRMRTPLVLKKRTPELGKYGAKITYYTSEDPTKFIYYGNWCGKGGRSAPVDNLDRCCLEHDKCYGKLIRQCPDVWKKPFSHMYAWTVIDTDIVCVRSEVYCINHVCECDRIAAECFENHLSDPSGTKHVGQKASSKEETDDETVNNQNI